MTHPQPPVSEPVARCLYCASLSLLTPGLHREAMGRAGRGDERVRSQARRVTAAAVGRGRQLALELGVGWGVAVGLIAVAMTVLTVWGPR